MLRQAISALLSRENTVRALRPSAMGMPSSSGITPSSGRPAASMASSMLLLSALSSLRRTRLTTKCSFPFGYSRSSITVRCASRRLVGSVVATTTARSAAQVASRKASPSPAPESMRQ